MVSSIQLLRSTTPQERPLAGNLLEGQPAVNLHPSEPGLFFKATDGSIIKIGPAAITSDGAPPNSSPVGSTGNAIGELWLDKSLDPPVLKIFDGSQWVDAGSGGGEEAEFIRWTYTASGGETTLSGTSGGVSLAYTVGLEQVFVNGALLSRGSDYTATTGTSVVLSKSLSDDDLVTVLSYIPADTVIVELPGTANLSRWTISATSSQTILSGVDSSGDSLQYTPGLESVYVNGAFLNRGVDYTATNGTSITMTDPLVLNDSVTVLALSEFSVAQVLASEVQFTGSGTGAVSRSVQAKLRDIVSVKDFGAAGNGQDNDTQAFINALASGATVHVPPGIYKITQTISFWNRNIVGLGDAEACVIEAHIPSATAPLLRAGRSAVISNLTLRYEASFITGSETTGQRVLIETYGGQFNFSLQRRSTIKNCLLGRCGTAVYSPASPNAPAFSVTFDTLEVNSFSFRGFDFSATTRTGNVYSNIYLKSGYSNVDCCFYMTGEESECVIDQLNAEHTSCSRAAIYLDGMRAMACNSIHIEGCDITTPGNSYIEVTRSSGSIESLSVYYTRMSQNNTSVLKLGSANYNDLDAPNTLRYLRVGTFHMKGIARPDAGLYPSYPTNRKGLAGGSTITGFYFVNRPASFTDRMALQIDSYVWNTSSTPNPDSSVYTAFPVDPNNNISFITKGARSANFNGMQFSGPVLLVGNEDSSYSPVVYDRNGNDYRPSFTWWFDDSTGISHPATSEIGVTLADADKYRFKAGSFGPTFDNQVSSGLSTNRWTDIYSVNVRPGGGTAVWTSGSGSPEGAVTAPVGSLYTRTDGGSGSTLYVKETGTGNTGWIAK